MAEDHGSLNQLWDYLKGHDSEITEVKTQVAELRVGQQATNSKLDMVFHSMTRMEGVLNRPPQSPNYTGFATAFIGASALIGSLFWASISPLWHGMENLQKWKEERQSALVEESYKDGRRDQAIEDLKQRRKLQ